MSSSECEAAAEYLGLLDTSAKLIDSAYSFDPPYCFLERELWFNGEGTNMGECDGEDKCLCKSSGEQRNVFGIYLAMDEVTTFSFSYNRICYRFRVVYADI